MRAYRVSVNLKLGLIVFAVLIAVASLAYTNRLVRQLNAREQSIMTLWAKAFEQLQKAAQPQALNPYLPELRALERRLSEWQTGKTTATSEEIESYRKAILWAEGMPPASELSFITDAILVPNAFDIPALVTDAGTGQIRIWRNVAGVPDSLVALAPEDSLRILQKLEKKRAEMANRFQPIPIEIDYGTLRLDQELYFGESNLVRQLRMFPYAQFLFVGLFIFVGYLGFSYVRRSEQSSLWVGMAKEAAHQLGTPISSLMGWHQLLSEPSLPPEQLHAALLEIEKDIERLKRVTNRFSDIGSLPKLEPMQLEPVVGATAEYIRRRIPQQGKRVELAVEVPPSIKVALNSELFEWVIENLLKNALDAIESNEGKISISAREEANGIHILVQDTGKGIERRQWKNVFRPGYSTKKRGWGLGLSLAKRIIEDYHGGNLELCQSKVGHGTTFEITLPLPKISRSEHTLQNGN